MARDTQKPRREGGKCQRETVMNLKQERRNSFLQQTNSKDRQTRTRTTPIRRGPQLAKARALGLSLVGSR